MKTAWFALGTIIAIMTMVLVHGIGGGYLRWGAAIIYVVIIFLALVVMAMSDDKSETTPSPPAQQKEELWLVRLHKSNVVLAILFPSFQEAMDYTNIYGHASDIKAVELLEWKFKHQIIINREP